MHNRSLLALPIALLMASPAVAGISKNVSVEDALQGRVPVVVAVEGGGVNLDFSETGETVEKVTLDDTSKVLVDFDKSLPIIRLFRGNISSKDVPSAKTTQLSVTTKGSDGDFHLYIFPVTTSQKPTIYTKYLIGGEVVQHRGYSTLMTAATGAKVAQLNNTLVDPQLKARVAQYVRLRSGGMSDHKAASKAKISMALARRLDGLGQSAQASTTSPVVALPPAPAVVTATPAPNPAPVVAATPAPSSAKGNQSHRHKPKREPFVADKTPAPVTTEPTKVVQYILVDRVPEPLWSSVVSAPIVAAQPQPQSQPQPEVPVQPSKAPSNHDYANALLRGLNKARLDGHIKYGSRQWYSVNGAIRLLRRGASLDKAIAASGMQRDGFMKLLSAGGLVS